MSNRYLVATVVKKIIKAVEIKFWYRYYYRYHRYLTFSDSADTHFLAPIVRVPMPSIGVSYVSLIGI